MTAIAGCIGSGPDVPAALTAMLAAFAAGYGTAGARWAEGTAGLGGRYAPAGEAPSPGPSCAGVASGTPSSESPLRVDREAGLAVAADARLDDRDSLCRALGIPRPERAGLADVDLILRAWKRWGRECPDRLLGDYAFAVRDARRRRLFCVRDPIGVRPFYYSPAGGRFVFASAVEAVLAAPGVSGALDEAVVAARLTRNAVVTTTRTFFSAVRKLPPGHVLTVEGGGATARVRTALERYWRPERAPRVRPASDDACAEELLAILARAVEDRLHGPGPIGVHLSGGLDSSGVAVLAARALRRRGRPPPLAFSWLPPPGGEPSGAARAKEYAYVDAVCEREGLRVFHRSPGPGDVAADLACDGAYPGAPVVHLNEGVVQRCAAARGVRALLSGWGGDEGVSFNGRGYHAQLLLSGRWRTLYAECRVREAPLRLLARTVAQMPTAILLDHLRCPWWGPRSYRAFLRWRSFICPAFARRVAPLPWPSFGLVSVRRTQLQLLRQGFLLERLEGWAASGARHGIEYRYPLLDRRVLEFALGLPPDQFRRGPRSRWLMRHALSSPGPGNGPDAVLPDALCWDSDKQDPARRDALIDAIVGALPAVRRTLAARATPPSRAHYIDMPRLLECLDADRTRLKQRILSICSALQLLDF